MLMEAMEVLHDVKWADPFMEELHVKLGDLSLEMGEAQQALDEYLILLALDPVDKADANLKIAQAYNALGDEEKTMEYLLTALDIAPQYRPAQALLLELSRSDAETRTAAEEAAPTGDGEESQDQ
jgi:tetratricopeptide (TPR) repeat protein